MGTVRATHPCFTMLIRLRMAHRLGSSFKRESRVENGLLVRSDADSSLFSPGTGCGSRVLPSSRNIVGATCYHLREV